MTDEFKTIATTSEGYYTENVVSSLLLPIT